MRQLLAASILALALALPGTALAQSWDADRAIAAIGSYNWLRGAARADSVASVRVVRLSTLQGADTILDRLDSVKVTKAEDIYYLQSQLSQNIFARSAINGAGVSIEQIVSLFNAGEASVILYADDL